MRNVREILISQWWTDENIKNHYEYIKMKNDKNKKTRKELQEKYKKEIEEVKKHFKNVSVSLVWDWVWANNQYWRIFIKFNNLDKRIEIYK